MRFAFAALAFTLVVFPALADSPATGATFSVLEKSDVEYRRPADNESNSNHRRIDLYLPAGAKDFPVVLIVHGGAWMMGDKRWDQVPAIGRELAKHGIGAVGVNYRLSPAVQHPEHIRNVAEAFAWVHQHIGEFGGRSDKIAVMGHSAGGHLVALLATDDRYLKAHGLSRENVLAVIGISGVYQLSEMALNALGQRRRPNADGTPPPPLFEQIFGRRPDVAKDASPMSFVRSGLPPFLLIYAEKDLPTLALQAMALHSALRAQKVDSNLMKVDGRNHGTVMWQASKPGDPVLAATIELIRKTAKQAAAEAR